MSIHLPPTVFHSLFNRLNASDQNIIYLNNESQLIIDAKKFLTTDHFTFG